MNLKELIKVMPFKWRVQSVKEWGADCVAYVDARDVQDKLDEVCGHLWQSRYSEHKGNLFCSIGIKIGDEWIWRSDCGTESNVEKQKGEASDAFKRAAVMWGIGRFLYNQEIIRLDTMKNKQGKLVACYNGKILYGTQVTDACNYKIKNK
jgi:hypothetical protein